MRPSAARPPPGTGLARLIGTAMVLYLRAVAATARLDGSVSRRQAVLAFWHEYNLAATVVAMKRRADLPHASFSTRGFRGVVIRTLLRRSGDVRVVSLPEETDRVAARALALRLARLSAEGRSPVVTPDGPFGPYRVAKPGALIVARASRLPIVPWRIRVTPSVRLVGRWDRHVVPVPFCRIRVSEGQPIPVGERERLAPRLRELQAALGGISSVPGGERLP